MPNPNLVAGPGRPKGLPNKINAEIRGIIATALEEVGGKDYLVKIAKTKPAVFCALVGRIIPADLTIYHKSILDDLTADDIAVFRQALAGRIIGVRPNVIEGNVLPKTGAVPALQETNVISRNGSDLS